MTGILLIQLGTPDAPTAAALRPYLRQFLGDPRVIEVAARPQWSSSSTSSSCRAGRPQSAAKYRRIWDPTTGSPLLHYTRRQTELLQAALPGRAGRGSACRSATRRSATVVREMIAAGRRPADRRCRCTRSTRRRRPPRPPTRCSRRC